VTLSEIEELCSETWSEIGFDPSRFLRLDYHLFSELFRSRIRTSSLGFLAGLRWYCRNRIILSDPFITASFSLNTVHGPRERQKLYLWDKLAICPIDFRDSIFNNPDILGSLQLVSNVEILEPSVYRLLLTDVLTHMALTEDDWLPSTFIGLTDHAEGYFSSTESFSEEAAQLAPLLPQSLKFHEQYW